MHAALNPRRISNDELVYGNLISSCRAPIPFEWLGHRWFVQLARSATTPGPRFEVEADWGGARLLVRAPAVWLELIARAMLADGEQATSMGDGSLEDDMGAPLSMAQLPEPLRVAILEAAFARATAQIETATRKRFHIVSSGVGDVSGTSGNLKSRGDGEQEGADTDDDADEDLDRHTDRYADHLADHDVGGDADDQVGAGTDRRRTATTGAATPPDAAAGAFEAGAGLDTLGWTCTAGAQQFAGELLLDGQGMAFLATALRGWSGSLGSLDEWAGLPIPLRFAVGWVDLPSRTLAEVGPRDVIVLDETWLRALSRNNATAATGKGQDWQERGGYSMTVLAGNRCAFQAELHGSRITVTAGLGDIMADMAQAAILEDEGTLDDVTIRLTFDLGERSVTIAELRSLAPGFTFDLGRELRRSVTIRANGVAVGEGELVDIDGRVGVSVLTLNRFAD